MRFLVLIQDASEIEKKIQEAPDNSYEIGIAIGTYLPFVVLVLIAYAFYYYSKNRRNTE
ncbi:hypothetical protein [Maribacter hydrothermalis]|uniref:hypothetical protein n=1 Tax=Maribacter hydrothermalis TaxID=1836467 RepID=UPI000AF12BCE|nr:hypothetical protein [Maribacter hydrothermalis]